MPPDLTYPLAPEGAHPADILRIRMAFAGVPRATTVALPDGGRRRIVPVPR